MKNYTHPSRQNEFMDYMLSIKGNAISTVDSYNYDLELLFKFLKHYKGLSDPDVEFEDIVINDIDDEFIKSITLDDLYAFVTFTKVHRHNSNSSRARKVVCLRSFFTYLHKKVKVISYNPADELEKPKKDKRTPMHLNIGESKRLLKSVSGRNHERDLCIITIFLNCGVRLAELCGMNLSDIREDTLSVIGKGNKQRTVYLNSSCLRALGYYLAVRNIRDNPIDDEHADALFLSEQNKRINRRTVQYIVKCQMANAKLDKKYSPHKLRHTAATLMYKNNVDIRSLQEILGHESVATTQIYTHVDSDMLRAAVKTNPLNIQDED